MDGWPAMIDQKQTRNGGEPSLSLSLIIDKQQTRLFCHVTLVNGHMARVDSVRRPPPLKAPKQVQAVLLVPVLCWLAGWLSVSEARY